MKQQDQNKGLLWITIKIRELKRKFRKKVQVKWKLKKLRKLLKFIGIVQEQKNEMEKEKL